jgi:bacterioferritin-associated ferredoxin
MIVCVCRRVSDRHIAAAVRDGCTSFEELQAELGVATGCGACCGCARETFERQVAIHAGVAQATRGHQRVAIAVHRAEEALSAAAA